MAQPDISSLMTPLSFVGMVTPRGKFVESAIDENHHQLSQRLGLGQDLSEAQARGAIRLTHGGIDLMAGASSRKTTAKALERLYDDALGRGLDSVFVDIRSPSDPSRILRSGYIPIEEIKRKGFDIMRLVPLLREDEATKLMFDKIPFADIAVGK